MPQAGRIGLVYREQTDYLSRGRVKEYSAQPRAGGHDLAASRGARKDFR